MALMKKKNLSKLDMGAGFLAWVGALNWGLDVLNYNLVQVISNITSSSVGLVIYSLVGLSAVWILARGKVFKKIKII